MYQVLKPEEFLIDFTQEAKNAKKRFWAQAMFLEPGRFANLLTKIYCLTVAKKLDTRLNLDYFTLLFDEGKIHYLKPANQDKINLLKNLTNHDVKICLLNKPNFAQKLFPYFGRNHAKMMIIDNISYLGGLNFSDGDLNNIDFMVKITNKVITEKLAEIFLEFTKGKLKQNKFIKIDQDNKIIVNNGKIGQSLILKTAVEMINNAKQNVFFISQFAPDGKILNSLAKLRTQGKEIKVIAPIENHFNTIFKLLNVINKFFSQNKLKINFLKKDVHAKLLIIDDKSVMIGSNNLTNKGVLLGTVEIALVSTEKELVTKLSRFYKNI